MSKNNIKQPYFLVNDLETLRVLTDPLRLQILDVLNQEPQTVNQVAEKLGLSSSRLYYHFNKLEEHGLIIVVETRMVNNMVEKLYWVAADEIEFDKDLLSFSLEDGQDNLIKIILSSLDAIREDVIRSLQARRFDLEQGAKSIPRDMIVTSVKKKIKDETYQQFVQRFKALLDDYSALEDVEGTGEDINVYNFACYLYPSFYYQKERVNQERNEGQ